MNVELPWVGAFAILGRNAGPLDRIPSRWLDGLPVVVSLGLIASFLRPDHLNPGLWVVSTPWRN